VKPITNITPRDRFPKFGPISSGTENLLLLFPFLVSTLNQSLNKMEIYFPSLKILKDLGTRSLRGPEITLLGH
jgi:hypothetical protein